MILTVMVMMHAPRHRDGRVSIGWCVGPSSPAQGVPASKTPRGTTCCGDLSLRCRRVWRFQVLAWVHCRQNLHQLASFGSMSEQQRNLNMRSLSLSLMVMLTWLSSCILLDRERLPRTRIAPTAIESWVVTKMVPAWERAAIPRHVFDQA